jgi:metal-responsive CopG/Arc/MetJ family transcriptional regulator
MAGRKKMNKEDKKPTLTININENLLKKIDEICKKTGYLRSRLIEKLVNEYVEQNKNKI